MKALRYIFFIPIIILIVGLIFWLIPIALIGIMSLSKFWLIIFMLLFGGLAVATFILLPGGITWLSAKISPNKSFAFYTVLVISLLLSLLNIIGYWNLPVSKDIGLEIFMSLLFTCLITGITASLCVGAGIEMFVEKGKLLSIFMVVGSVIFYIGIFLSFCLLTTKLCYINPDKTYTWSSGIWHGIFVIPNWVLSWFIDEIYCKAPNSSTAYIVWWWISFIFTTLSILAGFGRRDRNE